MISPKNSQISSEKVHGNYDSPIREDPEGYEIKKEIQIQYSSSSEISIA